MGEEGHVAESAVAGLPQTLPQTLLTTGTKGTDRLDAGQQPLSGDPITMSVLNLFRPLMLEAMCGRVDIHTPPSQLARLLEVQLAAGVDPDGRPSWNVPPARGIPAITERHTRTEDGEKSDDHERVMDVLRWGLVPHWAKDPRTGYKMINARAETVTTAPSFRAAWKARRCLVPSSGFYE